MTTSYDLAAQLLLDQYNEWATTFKPIEQQLLNQTSKELELILQYLRLHPTRYVNVSLFGKKNKPYVAPVTDSIKK